MYIRTRNGVGMQIFTAAALLLLLITSPALAENGGEDGEEARKKYFYQWTDSRGDVHISDNLGKVPEPYRDAARKIEVKKTDQAAAPAEQVEEQIPAAGFSEKADNAVKYEWLGRITEWKNRLLSARKQYDDLDRERTQLLGRWGSAALAPVDDRLKANEIEQQMQQVQQEIDTATNMINVVIPEEARKAGVPPGWLRE